ncbi:MAG: site-2 protease family protein [Armatimonadetes bacterium]|nr:site-2 protease family protein [Armatimonadota bacterium]
MSAPAAASPWSIRLATVRGIPIRLHFSFLLLIVWIGIVSRGQATAVVNILALFGCVLLHELGHALTAQKFGIRIKDITLYPVGGVAMLVDRPKPKQEFWITLAGPSVNVVIALAAAVALALQGARPETLQSAFEAGAFLPYLLVANVMLAVFNMIPAFPMDGGRILRSVLAMTMPHAKATRIAGTIGQGLAILFGFLGLFTGQIVLMIIAFFVFVGAGAEMGQAMGLALTEGRTVREAMFTRFSVLQHGDTLGRAAELLLSTTQADFPVMSGSEVVGVLNREAIVRGLAEAGPTGYVAGYMDRNVEYIEGSEPLSAALERLSSNPRGLLVVTERGIPVGLLNAENLGEFLMLQQARDALRQA